MKQGRSSMLFLAVWMLLSSACARSPVSPPSFPDETFSGTVVRNGVVVPLQGMVTVRRDAVRFAVITMQGVLLGRGVLLPETRGMTVEGALDRRTEMLVEKIGAACLDSLAAARQEEGGPAQNAGTAPGTFSFASPDGTIALTFRRR